MKYRFYKLMFIEVCSEDGSKTYLLPLINSRMVGFGVYNWAMGELCEMAGTTITLEDMNLDKISNLFKLIEARIRNKEIEVIHNGESLTADKFSVIYREMIQEALLNRMRLNDFGLLSQVVCLSLSDTKEVNPNTVREHLLQSDDDYRETLLYYSGRSKESSLYVVDIQFVDENPHLKKKLIGIVESRKISLATHGYVIKFHGKEKPGYFYGRSPGERKGTKGKYLLREKHINNASVFLDEEDAVNCLFDLYDDFKYTGSVIDVTFSEMKILPEKPYFL